MHKGFINVAAGIRCCAYALYYNDSLQYIIAIARKNFQKNVTASVYDERGILFI